jgi:ADP-heptose:LPS heptosyltransferase
MHLWVDKYAWVGNQAVAKASKLDIDNIERIVVIKHAAVGDLILTRPFLITLREYFSTANLTLNVIKSYLSGVPNDLVNEVYIVDDEKSSLYRRHRIYKQFGTYDLLFDITATTRSFWISHFTKAKFKIGFMHKGIERLVYDAAVPRSDYKFEAESFLDQLLLLGLSYQWPLRFDLQHKSFQRDKPFILYFPTASTKRKCWSVDNFSKLISLLCKELPKFDHIILKGLAGWEKNICLEIQKKIGKIRNVALLSGGDDTPKFLKGAKLVVSNDTGIRNIAIALNTPTVGIFITTLPFRYFPHFGNHQVVFQMDGTAPSVNKVKEAVLKVIATK